MDTSSLQTPPSLTWIKLREEPYRLLFPLGWTGAAIGMGIWIPFFFWPQIFAYPGQGHAVIQIQGFLLCFVFGFLGTMLPKVLGLRPLGSGQLAIFFFGLLGVIIASLVQAPRLAQAIHMALLINFLLFVGARLRARKSNPPPTFAFIAAAMAADLGGTLCKLLALSGAPGTVLTRAGSLLQYQAFPLLLILGVGGFLLPKLLAGAPVNPQSLSKSGPAQATPWPMAGLFLISYAFEIAGLSQVGGSWPLRSAYALRSAVWIAFLFRGMRLHGAAEKLPPYLAAARASLVMIAVGLVLPVFWPSLLLAWEHIVFIGGFLLLTFSVAARVLSAHGARLDTLALHERKERVFGALVFLAMLTRVTTAIWPAHYMMHLAIAAGFALGGLAIWARIYFPLLTAFPAPKAPPNPVVTVAGETASLSLKTRLPQDPSR